MAKSERPSSGCRVAAASGTRKGAGTRVLPDVDPAAMTSDDIGELKAIYRRYGGDATQPASLEESANASN
jgi:hypothetical protein